MIDDKKHKNLKEELYEFIEKTIKTNSNHDNNNKNLEDSLELSNKIKVN